MRDWFTNPRYDIDSPETDERLDRQSPERDEEAVTWGAPMTVDPEGRISGHIALWGRCHVGFGNTCVRPPREDTAYQGFLTGKTAGVPTGPIMLGGQHAPLHASASEAVDYYASTSTAVADVTVGPDAFGIWAAGAVRPNADEAKVNELQASAPSGDWRSLVRGGPLRLIAILAVNTPGFRVHRAHALAASGTLITYGPTCNSCDGPSIEDEIAFLREKQSEIEQRQVRLELEYLTAGITAP